MGASDTEGGVRLSREAVGRIMRGNRSKDTRPELLIRRALRDAGWQGYRIHWSKAPGRPDIAYPGRRVAIFVNGCFWHRCPHCALGEPRTNAAFWSDKFARNIARDARVQDDLAKAGWTVFVIWECEAKTDASAAVDPILRHLRCKAADSG